MGEYVRVEWSDSVDRRPTAARPAPLAGWRGTGHATGWTTDVWAPVGAER